MEKRTPHCKLTKVKSLITEGSVAITGSALKSGDLIGFDAAKIIVTVMALTTKDFFKSMTSYNDHTVWHDVYTPSTLTVDIYQTCA